MRSLTMALLATLLIGSQPSRAQSLFKFQADVGLAKSRLPQNALQGLPDRVDAETLVADLKLDADVNHSFWHFVYGDENSQSVCAMLVQQDQQGYALFLDLNRDHQLTETERQNPDQPGLWQVTLPAEFVVSPDESEFESYSVQIRFDSKLEKLTLTTTGYMAGQIDFEGQPCTAQYHDLNSNGRWFDPEDRILIDVNVDEKLNPILERFACKGLCRINQQQYSIAGDRSGRRLNLQLVDALGSVTPEISLAEAGEVTKFKAALSSTNGIRVSLDEPGKEIRCPVGRYRVERLEFTVASETQSVSFIFLAKADAEHWIEIQSEESESIDLLGQLSFTAASSVIRENDYQSISIYPRLTSATGLYLFDSRSAIGNGVLLPNRLKCTSSFQNKVQALATTGFS